MNICCVDYAIMYILLYGLFSCLWHLQEQRQMLKMFFIALKIQQDLNSLEDKKKHARKIPA